MTHDDYLLRVPEAAKKLGLRVSTIRKMITERRIDVVRPTARAVRIAASTVDEIIRRGACPAVNGGME
jgi:excisionase family DNA binding protein